MLLKLIFEEADSGVANGFHQSLKMTIKSDIDSL